MTSFLLAIAALALAAPRHRAALPPPPGPPAAWIEARAIPMATVEPVGGVDDLAPVAGPGGKPSVVALGEGTHGTHEFFTAKLRILRFLVERMGFDVLAMEASYPQMERVNAYVQGGGGDLHQLLLPQPGETLYYFWDVRELAAVVEWMRQYNLTRGSRPAIEIVGADVHDGASAGNLVVDYLRSVDGAEADAAVAAYACQCESEARRIAGEIAANEAAYTERSSGRQFADAVHAATVVVQSFNTLDPVRDPAMADNVAWAREHRGTARKVVYWGHNEHVTKFRSVFGSVAAGEWLSRKFGNGYFAFGSATFAGRYLTRPFNDGTSLITPELTPAGDDAYELLFHAVHTPAFIAPLGHPYFAATHHLREACSGAWSAVAPNWDIPVVLSQKFDAIIWIDQTTPTTLQ